MKTILGNARGTLFVVMFACIAVFFAVAVWPFYNLIPEYITGKGTVVSNSDGKCYIHTDGNFMITADHACGNAKADDRILVEDNVKIKDRMDAGVRHQ